MPAVCGVEDRNRTAPFPFCGNRFEFRAVGSSQNCSFPIAACNTVMASGMAALSALIEGGMSHRDAVAKLFKDNRHVIFTGNGYSAEWPAEAARRGLPNLQTTPSAVATFNSEKAKSVFKEMGIFEAAEVDARADLMLESYNTILDIEARTMLRMVDTGILPACIKDLATYKDAMELAGERKELYTSIRKQADALWGLLNDKPHGSAEKEAFYYCDTVKPQMETLRALVDKAEGLMQAELYPYPTYEALVYSHQV